MGQGSIAADGAGPLLFSEDIDLDFVPVPVEVVGMEVDDELVLLDVDSLGVRHLDRIGAIVWQCFDGTVSLDELVDELAEAFAEDRSVIGPDVLRLARDLGASGLLVGVAARTAPVRREVVGLAEGTELGALRLPALGGGEVALAQLSGRPLVLVSWSPTCSYCVGLVPRLRDRLADGPAPDVVLVARGSAEANRALLDEHGLAVRVGLADGALDELTDPFSGQGTPVAYLLDGEGRVASPLALGGEQVLQLLSPGP